MNNRERFHRTMRFQPVDRPFNHETGLWGQTIDRWQEEGGLPRDVHVGTELLWGNEHFGIDRMGFVPLKCTEMLPPFEEETLEEDKRYIVKRHADGHVSRALKEGTSHGMRLSMDQYISWAVRDRESWEAVKKRFDASSPARYPPYWDDVVRCLSGRDYPLCVPPLGTFGLYSFLRRLMGTESACTIFYDDPVMAEDMLDFLTNYLIELITRPLQDLEIDFFFYWEDFAYNTGPLISPRIFRKFLLPRYRRICDFVNAHGVEHVWIDTDGNPEILIPLLIEAGITLLWPLERAAGVDPLRLRAEYGHDLALGGGVDKRALAKGPKAIEEELYHHVPQLIEDGGYFPSVDHWVPPDVSYGNFAYYLETKRKILGM